jgi:hypothetical protein
MDNPETQGTLNQDAKRRQKRTKRAVNIIMSNKDFT